MKLVLPLATLLASAYALPAFADQAVQPTRSVYGCVDPRATTALAIPDGRLRNRKWVDYVHRNGQCVLLPAGRTLTVLAHQGPLLLLKAPDASADTLPVYAQSSDMTAAAADAAPVATPAPVPAPVQADPIPAPPPPTTVAPQPAATPTPDQSPAGSPPATTPPAEPAPAASAPVAPVPPTPPIVAAPPAVVPSATPDAAPATAPAVATPAPVEAPVPVPTPVPESATPPAPAPAPVPVQHGSSGMAWLLVVVVLALLALVGAAVLISRQQRRFTHVEDADWPQRDNHADPLSTPSPVVPAVLPEPTPQNFRKNCVDVLEQGGWTIQPSFAAGAAREGAPDILGRRRDAVLAVRCRGGSATVTPEIIDEVAAMGQQARAHVTVLATPAPLTRRAHDEAMRLHVHVLDQDELGSLSA